MTDPAGGRVAQLVRHPIKSALAERMLSKMSGRFPWLHMIRYCCMKVIVLFVIQ